MIIANKRAYSITSVYRDQHKKSVPCVNTLGILDSQSNWWLLKFHIDTDSVEAVMLSRNTVGYRLRDETVQQRRVSPALHTSCTFIVTPRLSPRDVMD